MKSPYGLYRTGGMDYEIGLFWFAPIGELMRIGKQFSWTPKYVESIFWVEFIQYIDPAFQRTNLGILGNISDLYAQKLSVMKTLRMVILNIAFATVIWGKT